MAARTSVEERLRLLRSVRDSGDTKIIREAAAKHLSDSSNLIVAEAAKLIGTLELSGMELVMLTAWKRLMDHPDPMKVDKGCYAKAAIIESLGRLSYDDPDFYLVAIRYQQMEPAWMEPIDTAENVRAGSAFALARSHRLRANDKLNAFVDLLQGSRSDRMSAAKAIADTGHESAIPLLRLKLLCGDDHPEAMGICMIGLLDLATTASIPLIISFLTNPTEAVVVEAAAALGQCGHPDAVAALIAAWEKTSDPELGHSLLISIGLSRSAVATKFLISLLETGQHPVDAIEALRPACVYQETQQQVRQILKAINDPSLIALFDQRDSH